MVEEKVAFVPRLRRFTVVMYRDYALLVTTERSIFVPHKPAGLAAADFATYGATEVFSSRDPEDEAWRKRSWPPEGLAMERGSIVVPHASIWHLATVRSLGQGLELRMDYLAPNGRLHRLRFAVSPPSELVMRRRIDGLRKREIVRDYAAKVQEAFRRALPMFALVHMEEGP